MRREDTYRRCHSCGFTGHMEVWGTGALDQFLALLLLLCGLIPGVILLFAKLDSLKCTKCGKPVRARQFSGRIPA